MGLGDERKRTLLKIAREAITAAVDGKAPPPVTSTDPELGRPSGVFVTLHEDDELRGCIGYVEPVFPLGQATQDAAVKAALEDPRFDPVIAPEVARVSIEISVLSALEELRDLRAVEVGKHGLVIESGRHRGLLLPQVATEYGWDREQFLTHTALKAGLPPDSWKQAGVRLFTFTVEKFSEAELAASGQIHS